MAEDEFSLRRATDRAAKARTILDSDIVNEAWDVLGQACFDAWLATDPRDTDGRERLWVWRTVLTKFKGHFETAVTDGKIASHQLADLDQKRQAGNE